MKFHSFMVFIIDNPMEPFALFILWSLLGISGPQYVLSISRDLEPRLESTLFDELSLEDTKPTDQASLLDSNWLSDNVDSIDSDPNILFSDIPYLDGTDSGSLFAKTDNACDVGTADDVQLFGKKRRDASTCKNTFTGQVGNQNEPDEGNGSDQSGESNQENLPLVFTPTDIFPKEFDVCPPTIFKDSNIPVCRVFLPGTYILIPGEQYVTLLDVAPRRSSYSSERAILEQRLIKCLQSPRSSSQRCV